MSLARDIWVRVSDEGLLIAISRDAVAIGERVRVLLAEDDIDVLAEIIESKPMVCDGAVRHRLVMRCPGRESGSFQHDGWASVMNRSYSFPEDSRLVGQLGVLTRERCVRLLDCSVSGCLFEANSRVPISAIGSVRVTLDGREMTDDVQVVRCQPIAGAGETYHVGVQFLWTRPLADASLRRALRTSLGEIVATIQY